MKHLLVMLLLFPLEGLANVEVSNDCTSWEFETADKDAAEKLKGVAKSLKEQAKKDQNKSTIRIRTIAAEENPLTSVYFKTAEQEQGDFSKDATEKLGAIEKVEKKCVNKTKPAKTEEK